MNFSLQSPYNPTGDQPKAIERLVKNIRENKEEQILLGVTGSGKTFTMANVIEQTQRPTLIICHNKTLAAQLSNELTEFFPNNAVCYFVSYYDYYLPESYIPSSDTYLEKETDINDEVDRLRHYATEALLSRDDVIIVASVSCIYGLGTPEDYMAQSFELEKGQKINRQELINKLIEIYFERNDYEAQRGTFSIRGDSIEIRKSSTNERLIIDLWGDEIESIINTGQFNEEEVEMDSVKIFPAQFHVTEKERMKRIVPAIEKDLKDQLAFFQKRGKLVEAQRLKQRVTYDLEMMQETGYVNGIENYSRYLTNRQPGEPPAVLLDFFKLRFPNFLTIVDESHITLPQIRGMYAGDRSRKQTLVDYGFRLPSCMDNRPLTFDEFEETRGQVIYSSATPGVLEYGKVVESLEETRDKACPQLDWGKQKNSKFQIPNVRLNPGQSLSEYLITDYRQILDKDKKLEIKVKLKEEALKSELVAQQLIRPTGLLDPKITVKTVKGQIDDLLGEIEKRIEKKQRVLVTTLTKKNAEAFAKFLEEKKIKAYYIHADVENMERLEILRDLRTGVYDVVVGINLLREGLDLPEVSLVAILDADKEGFLRNETSLVQTIGRAARHVEGEVIMYADKETPSMREAIKETERRRKVQEEFNEAHGITPQGIHKKIGESRLAGAKKAEPSVDNVVDKALRKYGLKKSMDGNDEELLAILEDKMDLAARNLEFERAAEIRDLMGLIKKEKG